MPKILSELKTLLETHNIKTEKLIDTTGLNNNLTFTDYKNVFIKVNQQGRPYESLIRELKVASIIPNAIKPLHPEYLEVAPNQIATIWEYKNLTPIKLTPTVLQEIAENIEELHKTPFPLSSHILNPGFIPRLSSHVKARILEGEKRNFSPSHLNMLKEIYNNLLTEPEKLYPSELVVCHNDLHTGNIVLNGEHVQLIDWEAAILAPKELDYARLKIELSEEQYQKVNKTTLNEELINLYIQLLELSKAAYSTRFPEQDEKSKQDIEKLYAIWDFKI